MAKNSSISIGRIILQIALACFLTIGGIFVLVDGKGAGDEAVKWLYKQADLLGIVFAIVEIIAGVLLLIELFLGDRFGMLNKIIGWTVIIVFAIVIVLSDIINGNWGNAFLKTLYQLAGHLVPLGAMLCLLS